MAKSIRATAEENLAKLQAATANTPAEAVSVGATSTTIIASNDARCEVLIVNVGSQIVYVKFGSGATVAAGIPLAPAVDGIGGFIQTNSYSGIITGIVAAGTAEVRVVEV